MPIKVFKNKKRIVGKIPLFLLLLPLLFGVIISIIFRNINQPSIIDRDDTSSSEILGASAPNILSFQGRLTDLSDTPITTTTTVTFKIYNVPTVGTPLWTGSCSITPDQDGIFNTLLGGDCGSSIPDTLFSENDATYLGITVGTDTEMTPRQRIASSPYALNADTLDGFDSSQAPGANKVVVLDEDGYLVFGASDPLISAPGNIYLSSGASSTVFVKNKFGVLEGGTSPSFYTILQGGDQTGDITYMLPSSSSSGLLKNSSGTLSWDTTFASYATGDLLYASASDTLSKRGIGTAGQVLTVSDGLPVWADSTASASKWNTITNPDGDQTLTMSTYNTTWNFTSGGYKITNDSSDIFFVGGSSVGIGTATPSTDLEVKGLTNMYSQDMLSSEVLLGLDHTATYTENKNITGNLLSLERDITYSNMGSGEVEYSNYSKMYSTENKTTFTHSHTVQPGSNRLLLVHVGIQNSVASRTVTSITYNGTSLTKVDGGVSASTTSEIWYMIAPDTGTYDVIVNLSSSSWALSRISIAATTWFGINQVTPLGTATKGIGQAGSSSINVTSATGEIVIDTVTRSATTASPGTGQTAIYNEEYTATSTKNGETTTNMSWTFAYGNYYVHIAVPIRPASDANSLNLYGSLASLTSNCTNVYGICVDVSNVLTLNQSNTNATGAVLNILNSGTGPDILFADGSLVKIADTGTLTWDGNLYMDGKLGIGNPTPLYDLDVEGEIRFTHNSSDILYVGNGGVGIGTTTPSTDFEVKGFTEMNNESMLTNEILLGLDHTATYTDNKTITGNLISLNRDITYNNTGSGEVEYSNYSEMYFTDNITTFTHSHTVQSGINRLLLVHVGIVTTAVPRSVNSITYNGQALTKIISTGGSSGYPNHELWYLIDPPSGTYDIVVNTTSNLYSVLHVSVGATTWFGVNQTDPIGTASYNQANSSSSSVNITSQTGELVVDSITIKGSSNRTLTPETGQTEIYNRPEDGGMKTGASYKAGELNTTMTWTISSTATIAHVAVPLRPASDANSLNLFGPLASLSSNCTNVYGLCIDSSNILELSQNYSSATGAVLNIQNSGSGPDIMFNDSPILGMNDGETMIWKNNNGDSLLSLFDDGGNGKLGIGTNNPDYHLDINSGTTNETARFSSSDNESLIYLNDNDTESFLGVNDNRQRLGFKDDYQQSYHYVGSEEGGPGDITFNDDGTKMYVIGTVLDPVYQYELSTPWDVSTASYTSKTLTISSQENSPTSLAFDTTGTILYIVGTTNDTVYQYTLSTAWDISTGSYASKSFSVTTEEANPRGLTFNPNGTGMYIVGSSSDAVFYYTLSTAWDVSTASYSSTSFSVSAQDGNPYKVLFNSVGTSMYILGWNTNAVYQYTLSTAWDISTASYASKSLWFRPQVYSGHGLAFNPDGNYMYIVGVQFDTVFRYTLSTAWDISTGKYISQSFGVWAQEANPRGITFHPDGTAMYMVGSSSDTVFQYSLSSPWDVHTASYTSKSFLVSSQDGNPYKVLFNSNGTSMYILGWNTDTVYQYTLSTAWDVSTASYASKSFSVTSQDGSPSGIAFNPDGTIMYYVGITNDTVYQYTLSTAWDISTASYATKSFSVNTQDGGPTGIYFNPEGTTMYMSGTGNDRIYQYSLTTPWDISSASYASKTFNVNTSVNDPQNVAFDSNGEKMYMVCLNTDTVFQYYLSTPWDISTASYLDNWSIHSNVLVITKEGSLGIGTYSPTQALDVIGSGRFSAVGTGTYSSALNITADGTLTTATSDERLKTNIVTIAGALDKVMQLEGVYFNWIEDENGKRMTGMIAQDVMEVMPELVFLNKVDGYYGINYGETTGLLVEAIKEQQTQIQALSQIYDSENLDELKLQMNASKFLKLTLNDDGDIELLGGEILLQGDGTLSIRKLRMREGYSIGSSKILANEKSVTIVTEGISENSKIFLNPTSNTFNQVLYVSDVKVGESFTVNIYQQVDEDITFDWFLVDSWLPKIAKEKQDSNLLIIEEDSVLVKEDELVVKDDSLVDENEKDLEDDITTPENQIEQTQEQH